MTATAHAIVGGAIASSIGHPILAPMLAFTSHFLMDCVPHWDFGTNWRSRARSTTGALAVTETLVGITVAYLLFREKADVVILSVSIIASLLPDWLETPWYIFFAHQKKHQPDRHAGVAEIVSYHIYKTENILHTKASFPFGVVTQIATVVFFLVLLQPFR